MDHGGEAPRPTAVGTTDLGMAAAVQGGEAHTNTTGTFHVQLGAATAARRASFEPTAAAANAYHVHSSAEFTRHVRAASGGEFAVPVAVAMFVFHREPGPGVVYANIGASWRQLGPSDAALADPQLPGGAVPVLHVHHNYGANSALQPPPGAGRAEGIVGALPSLGAGYGGSGAVAVADDVGAAYNNLGIMIEYLRRLLPFAGIGASSVAVNGLAAGPGSPAVAFDLFALLLSGLFLLILHVLR